MTQCCLLSYYPSALLWHWVWDSAKPYFCFVCCSLLWGGAGGAHGEWESERASKRAHAWKERGRRGYFSSQFAHCCSEQASLWTLSWSSSRGQLQFLVFFVHPPILLEPASSCPPRVTCPSPVAWHPLPKGSNPTLPCAAPAPGM